MWTREQIKNHQEAAKRLKKIIDAAFGYIKENKNDIMEKEVQIFIYERIKESNLIIDKTPVIVAFGKSSADPHYNPTRESNKRLQNNNVIMIDLWARIDRKNAPFADITWMGYFGKKIPQEVQKVFDIVVCSRNEGIKFIKNKLKKKEIPMGKEVDKIVRDHIHFHGYGYKFIHGTGHSLGLHGPHGNKSRLNKKGQRPLCQNVAYTIEPGIYLQNKFGMRSEIDFYIDEKYKLIITTRPQKSLILT